MAILPRPPSLARIPKMMIFLGAIALSLLVNIIFAQLTDDDRDSPLFVNRSDYLGHKWFSSTVAGNYLYIDGGEILYRDGNDTVFIDARSSYSIDVSSSWTNAKAVIKPIDKAIDGRALNHPKLWPALDKSSFYSYNGEKGWFYTPANPPSNKLYKFTSDGSGGGQWSEDDQSYTASSNFTNLARVGGSASACGPDTCYAVGGWRNSRTDNALKDDDMPASGIVSYNLTSRQWYNDTLIGSVFKGPWREGQIFFTKIAGREGVLILIGGSVSNLAGGNLITLSFSYVYVYDIATKSWHQQTTGGDVPPLPALEYCAVGLQGDNPVNKTYEIFIYSAYLDSKSNVDYNDVWVLSIPSFQWHRAGQSQRGRMSQSCNVAGHRQMIIIGGLRADGRDRTAGDDWPLGLGVFDLSEMVFKNRYDADASVYTSPQEVKKWYAKNGPKAKDISPDVEALFDRSSAAVVDPSGGSYGSSGSSSYSDSGSVSVNKHALAGGVVGGVILLAALIAGIWIWARRRRRRRRRGRQDEITNISQPLMSSQPIESDSRARYEADGRQKPQEKEVPPQRHELP